MLWSPADHHVYQLSWILLIKQSRDLLARRAFTVNCFGMAHKFIVRKSVEEKNPYPKHFLTQAHQVANKLGKKKMSYLGELKLQR